MINYISNYGPCKKGNLVAQNLAALDLAGGMTDIIMDQPWATACANGTEIAAAYALTVGEGGGTVSVAANTLILANNGTSASVRPTAAFIYQDDPFWIEFDADPNGGTPVLQLTLMNGASTAKGYFRWAAAVTIAGSDLSFSTVTPSNYDADIKQRMLVMVDNRNLKARLFMHRLDTATNDKYSYLGEVTLNAVINNWQLSTGASAGTHTISRLRVYRSRLAIIGDSLLQGAGGPNYSPVPGHVSDDPTGSVEYWMEQASGGKLRCLNFGQGGQGTLYLVDTTEQQGGGKRYANAFVGTGLKALLIWIGTNDISGSAALATMQSRMTEVLAAISADDVMPILVNTVPRDNYTDLSGTGGLTIAQKNALRQQWNAWQAAIAPTYGGICVDADAVIKSATNDDLLATPYNADDVHLTVGGYQRVCQAVVEAINAAR